MPAAEAWMRDDDMNAFPENLRNQTQIHQELQRVLPGHDPFWPRWIVTTGIRLTKGVKTLGATVLVILKAKQP